MSELVLGIDAGNYRVKVAGAYGILSYNSSICEWFQRDIVESFGDDDMEFEIAGRKGFAGSIAEYEDAYGGISMYGDSKAHDDTKVKVLLGISRYINQYCPGLQSVSIVVGQPIKQHVQKDKEFIQDMLKGFHDFTVNGVRHTIWIENVGVAAEGSGAYWSNPSEDSVRIIDVGSGTVNMSSIVKNNHVNNMSDTLNFGMETGKSEQELESMVRGVIRGTTRLQWEKDDDVLVCGGIAQDVVTLIRGHYHKAKVLQPILRGYGDSAQMVDSTYSNAVGFYEIAKEVFQ